MKVHSKSTKVLVASVAVAAAMALTGCGGDKEEQPAGAGAPTTVAASPSAAAGNGVAALSADEILQKAQDALKDEKSFRVKGSVDQDGQQTDLDLKLSGEDFAGSMAMGKAKVELLSVGGKKYLKPNEQFFVMSTNAQQGKALAQVINGRWIAGAEADDSFKDLFSVADWKELLKPSGAVSKGEEKQVEGVPVITLKDAGDKESALYIATTGEPYPVQLVGEGASKLTFSQFGETFTEIAKPAAKEIVDLSKLGAK
ncbi:hypothetical protein [Actinoplanes sp. N902-109]|uniref:hypothetical protein n=1 Tax=Actinoplanes sp. (strain N902-109) TaxID=649831 RepID=UPI0012F968D6|nr:hypothetical protein [Actinoplanes sp. N902-109]